METIFTVGEETTVGKIKEFEILENVMYVRMTDNNVYPLRSISKRPPQPQKEEQRCGICGGGMVLIRGKYPKEEKRAVCATCNTERLEQINEISSSYYGQASQVNSKQ